MIRRRRSRSERAIARQQVRAARIERKTRINELRKYTLGHVIGVFSAHANQDLNITNEELRQLLVSSTDEEIQTVRDQLQRWINDLGPDGRECAAERYLDFIDCVSPPEDKVSEEERSDLVKKARERIFGDLDVHPLDNQDAAERDEERRPAQGLPEPVSDLAEGGFPPLIDDADVAPGEDYPPLGKEHPLKSAPRVVSKPE